MKSSIYIILFLTNFYCFGQQNKCHVYQYAGNEISKKHIALSQTYNSQGLIITETYSNYKRNSAEGREDGTFYYYYEDTLLIKRIFVNAKEDTTKVLCFYNLKEQLIKEEFYSCERRLKKDVDKGLGRPGGCIVFEEDYEKTRTWKKISEINYSYDNLGRIILYDATKLHFSSQNRYTWAYDNKNRISKYCSFENDRLIWTRDFIYTEDGYKYSTIWYKDGKPEVPEYWNKESFTIYTRTFHLNEYGETIKEVITNDKNENVSIEETVYNKKRKIAKTIFYNAQGNKEITHIYEYK